MTIADRILTKLLVDPDNGDQHYVDLDMGVFDVRVELTPEEIAYCRALAAQSDGLDGGGQ